MPTDFSHFRERLLEACKLQSMTPDSLARSIGMGARRAIDLECAGLKALDIHRLSQIADRLNVSVDWLLGRTTVMELAREKKQKRASSASAFRRG
jgi:transcriptional regulator with XRE-family HTH domain